MAVRVDVVRFEVVRESARTYDVTLKDRHVDTPEEAAAVMESVFRLSAQTTEVFVVLMLDTKNKLLSAHEVSRGSLNASIVHPRELFKAAVASNAASVVVGHNHPSGDVTPSGADIQLTRRLVKAGDVLGIEVLDSIVLGDRGQSASLRDLGLM